MMRGLSKIHGRVVSAKRQRGFFMFGGGKSRTYQIQRSLRLRASASAYLYRTFGTATNRKKSTLSMWVKRGALGRSVLFSAYSTGTDRAFLEFDSSDRLSLDDFIGSQSTLKTSTRVFRDPTAFLHIVLAIDTTAAVDEDRVIIWVNNERITSWASNTKPGLNIDPGINGPRTHRFGETGAGSGYADLYLAEPVFVDGQALTPGSFAQYDASGNWQPKKYTGTWGNNGTYPDFSDPTSTTTLMVDRSGNGNNWTASNISLTAGSTYDSMLDVPLGGGGQERGNYCVLNPLAKHAYNASAANGNLGADNGGSTAGNLNVSGSSAIDGLVYMEFTATNLTGTLSGVGFCGVGKPSVSIPAGGFPGSVADTWGFGVGGGTWYKRSAGAAAVALSLTGVSSGTVMGIAYNKNTGNAWVSKDGVFNGSGNPATGANPDITGITTGVDIIPLISVYSDGANSLSWHCNFGQRPFAFTPPTGFKALHTGNLSTPSVPNPKTQFDVATWTGNGATQSITSLLFKPGLLWGKVRSAVTNWSQNDAVRGASYRLSSNSTAAEINDANVVSAFLSNGFSVGSSAALNGSGASVSASLWKEGGAAAANNAGTITSQVSSNPTAGMTIFSWTGNGVASTVGHGLGAAVGLIIMKARSSVRDWIAWHKTFGSTDYIHPNLVNAKAAGAAVWSASPTSSVFSVGTDLTPNESGATMIGCAFTEIDGFSKFPGYSGNGSADGPYVHCGFRPKWVLIKRTDSTGNWCMHDSVRSPQNPMNEQINPNLNAAESGSGGLIDFTANGFKIRTTSTDLNANGGVYMVAAFAESPFKTALAR